MWWGLCGGALVAVWPSITSNASNVLEDKSGSSSSSSSSRVPAGPVATQLGLAVLGAVAAAGALGGASCPPNSLGAQPARPPSLAVGARPGCGGPHALPTAWGSVAHSSPHTQLEPALGSLEGMRGGGVVVVVVVHTSVFFCWVVFLPT